MADKKSSEFTNVDLFFLIQKNLDLIGRELPTNNPVKDVVIAEEPKNTILLIDSDGKEIARVLHSTPPKNDVIGKKIIRITFSVIGHSKEIFKVTLHEK